MPEKLLVADMLADYSVSFIAYKEAKGHYTNGGDWVPAGQPEPVDMMGVILPLSDDDLRYAENGTYSVKDRKLFTVKELKMGQKILYKGIHYTVQNFKDYSDYTDAFIYLARWAGNEPDSI